MFDSHCHLHSERISDPGALIARARAVGVRGFLLAGVEPDGWEIEARLALAHADVWVSYGVHPQWIAEATAGEVDSALAALEKILAAPAVAPAALGEIGLDGAGDRRASWALQERAFRAQLALAARARLPVVLHVLDAHGRALELLRESPPAAGGVMHSYSGSAEMAREYISLGLDIAFAGTIASERAKKTHAAARAVPREHLLVETDAPDQTPAPHRPAPNEPAFLPSVVAALARVRGESAAEVAAYTEANARRLFTGGK